MERYKPQNFAPSNSAVDYAEKARKSLMSKPDRSVALYLMAAVAAAQSAYGCTSKNQWNEMAELLGPVSNGLAEADERFYAIVTKYFQDTSDLRAYVKQAQIDSTREMIKRQGELATKIQKEEEERAEERKLVAALRSGDKDELEAFINAHIARANASA